MSKRRHSERSGQNVGETFWPLSHRVPLAEDGTLASDLSGNVAHSDNAADLPAPVLGEGWIYFCKPCDHRTDATFKVDKYGIEGFAVGSAHVDRCPGGKECLELTAEWLSDELGRKVW